MNKHLFFLLMLSAFALLPSCSDTGSNIAPEADFPPEASYSVLENTVTSVAQSERVADFNNLPQERANIKFPDEFQQELNACFRVEIHTPYIGNEQIDEQIRSLAKILRAEAVKKFTTACAADKISVKDIADNPPYALDINYETSATFGEVISVLFLPSIYTGGAHPLTDIVPMNFKTQNGQRLEYNDLFGDTAGLLEFLSAHAYTAFRPSLHEFWDSDPTLAEGLDAKADNLSSFILNPQGLVLVFPPYQIAPYSEGVQSCLVPLDKLLRFKPKPGIWN
ncbi:MAG: DUF3298 and DUF4163 domain-containing protein [Deltaproteobacteria bacterium]|jgi:hypothetical protein|nr:DUF3298 and DUF4163 domain-containing protein [Deltaproteobacteria bacterium]